MSISGLLKSAEGSTLTSVAELPASSYPVISLNNGGEMTVSDNIGTYERPVLHVTIEVPTAGGFNELHVLLPHMTVLDNKGFTDEEVGKLLFEICRNQYTCIEVAERGWDNA